MTASPRPLVLICLVALSGLALSALAGCDLPAGAPVQKAATAAPRPDPAPLPPVVTAVSAQSLAMRDYYATVQTGLLMQGMLRTDRGGPDTPFTDRNLAENFLQVALFDEYADSGTALVAKVTPSHLRRWREPVRLAVEFGASVPLAQRGKDVARIAAFASELTAASGHSVSMDPAAANFHVLVLNEDERQAIGPRLRALVPGVSQTDISALSALPRDTYCVVFAYSSAVPGLYNRAIAVIRGEHPDLLRLTCIHEELAQGMGLANDSPRARPSIFNDDEEFALLTRQDALMLKMLYDPRFRPAMTLEEARPIAETIAADLMGDES